MRIDAGEAAKVRKTLLEMKEWTNQLVQQIDMLANKSAGQGDAFLNAEACSRSLKAAVGYGRHVLELAAWLYEASTRENNTRSEWLRLTDYGWGVVRNGRLIPFRMFELVGHAQKEIASYSHLPDFEEIKRHIDFILASNQEFRTLFTLCSTLEQHYKAHIDNPLVGSCHRDMDIRYETIYAIVDIVLNLFQPLFSLLRLVTAANETLVKELPNPVTRLPDGNLPR